MDIVKLLKKNIRIILVKPMYPGNVGSIARIMKNFGFEDLALVEPCNFLVLKSKRMAMNGYPILVKAKVYDNFVESIEGLHTLFAASARTGKKRAAHFNPHSAAKRITELIPNRKIGIVFGQEDKGLSNDIVFKCQNMVTIPTSAEFSSLNLSQSAALILFEIFSSVLNKYSAVKEEPYYHEIPAARESFERMFNQMEEVLLEIGYLDPNNPLRMMNSLRNIYERSELNERDIRIIRGIFHKMNQYKKFGRPPVRNKKNQK